MALLFILVGAGFRAEQARSPYARQSLDERAYGQLAIALAADGTYGSDAQTKPWHWPPGAPAVFALAHLIAPDASSRQSMDIPAAYWVQAIVGTATIVLAWAIARRLAGPEAAAVAAGAVALYPPLVQFTGEQLSEPLGAFMLTAAILAVAWAWPRRSAAMVVAGALLGAAVLVRADLLPATATVAAAVFLLRLADARSADTGARRSRAGDDTQSRFTSGGRRCAMRTASAFTVGVVAAIAPWSVVASLANDEFVPVTTGGPSALYVGTYLPGNGTTAGLKEDLLERGLPVDPAFSGRDPQSVPAEAVLNAVARRHPGRDRDAALLREAAHNLTEFAVGAPVDFAQMMLGKLWWMWGQPARGGAIPGSVAATALHRLVVAAAVAGTAAAIWRRRDPVAVVVAVIALTLTALHAVAVSQPRYALTLMPALFASGAAGWFPRGKPRSPARRRTESSGGR